MKPSSMKELIKSRFKSGVTRPIHIESSPGVGKTEIVRQVAVELGVGFKVIHAPLLQPEDYGFPVIGADRTTVDFVVSTDKFPMENSDCEETGIFLIDELPQADTSAQKILRNLIQEREIHGKKLKKGWTIVSTGNRVEDRSGANRLLSHLSNVLTRIDLEPSLDDWTAWALENDVRPEVIAFCRFKTELLNKFDAQASTSPTPRAWSQGVSESMRSTPTELERETFKGDVGDGAAAEFCGFLRLYRNLPSIDSILLSPLGAELPQDASTKFAIATSLAHRATEKNFSRLVEYMSRIGEKEFLILFSRDAIKLCPKIQATKEFIAWFSTVGSKLLN